MNGFRSAAALKLSLACALMLLPLLARPSAAGDIDLTGYTLTFHDEFDSLSVNAASPKGNSIWYYQPPYGAAAEFSDSIWDVKALSVSNGVLVNKAWIAVTDHAAGNHSYVPLGIRTSTGTALVRTVQPGTARTDAPGWWVAEVGMKFTTGASAINVASVGRWVLAGNTAQHLVRIVDAATGADVPGGSAIVDTATATAGAFAYANLPAPLKLLPNHTYYLLSSEGSGDSYYDDNTTIAASSSIAVLGSAYGNWHSGALSSVDQSGKGFAQTYGYFEARMQMPQAGTGSWPAWWLATNNFNSSTSAVGEEIDIVEDYGNNYTADNSCGVQEASHNWSNGVDDQQAPHLLAPCTPIPNGTKPWETYHIYGVKIDPIHMTWYIDGVQRNQIQTPTDFLIAPFYLLLDFGLGGGWPLTGMVNPAYFKVDWVRVYAPPASFAVGAPIETYATIGARGFPGKEISCLVHAGTSGVILDGPRSSVTGSAWWKAEFANGCRGFVPEAALKIMADGN